MILHRERHNKTPLKEMVIVHPHPDFLDDIANKLRDYVLEELNVKSLVPCKHTLNYATLRAEKNTIIENLVQFLTGQQSWNGRRTE